MNKIILPLLTAVMSTSLVQAASVSVTGSPNPVTGNIAALDDTPTTFASFDTSLGTLTSVEIQLVARERADITIENDTNVPLTAAAELSGFVTLTIDENNNGNSDDSLSVITTITNTSSSQNLGATDGTPDSGPDFFDFETLTSGDSTNSVVTSNATLLSFFEGDGITTRTALVTANGGWAADGVSDVTLSIANFEADAEVTVTYTYTPVPEPSSALLGLAGACLLLVRRKRA